MVLFITVYATVVALVRNILVLVGYWTARALPLPDKILQMSYILLQAFAITATTFSLMPAVPYALAALGTQNYEVAGFRALLLHRDKSLLLACLVWAMVACSIEARLLVYVHSWLLISIDGPLILLCMANSALEGRLFPRLGLVWKAIPFRIYLILG